MTSDNSMQHGTTPSSSSPYSPSSDNSMQHGTTSTSSTVAIQNLGKRYGRVTALADVHLTLPSGSIVALMGPNGSGKTTLLKILAGVLSNYQGDVQICGHQPGPKTKALVSYLPDKSNLFTSYTIGTTIQMYADFFADFNRAKAVEMVESFGLGLDQKIQELSLGMEEKVNLALALSRNAKLYIFDEPLSGIDPLTRTEILQRILAEFNPESTMIIATHLINEIEAMCDYAVFLRYGSVLLHGDADELRSQNAKSLEALFKEQYS